MNDKSSEHFTLTLITKDVELAQCADQCGIDRIGVDIERIGKHSRQANIADARISDHTFADLDAVGGVVRNADLFARLNPLHAKTDREIELALVAGAKVLMLPQFSTPAEVSSFLDMVDGEAEVILLLETLAALDNLDTIVQIEGIHEVMIGLNDLGLVLGLNHPMLMVASPIVDMISVKVRRAGLRLGVGGVSFGETTQELPVKSSCLLARYAELGSRAAWISRSFLQGFGTDALAENLEELRRQIDIRMHLQSSELRVELQHFRQQVEGLQKQSGVCS